MGDSNDKDFDLKNAFQDSIDKEFDTRKLHTHLERLLGDANFHPVLINKISQILIEREDLRKTFADSIRKAVIFDGATKFFVWIGAIIVVAVPVSAYAIQIFKFFTNLS
jgi:hypothetical protein